MRGKGFISLVLRIQKFTLMRKGLLVFDPCTCGPAPELHTLLSFRMRDRENLKVKDIYPHIVIE